jgi:hypothetical protein
MRKFLRKRALHGTDSWAETPQLGSIRTRSKRSLRIGLDYKNIIFNIELSVGV